MEKGCVLMMKQDTTAKRKKRRNGVLMDKGVSGTLIVFCRRQSAFYLLTKRSIKETNTMLTEIGRTHHRVDFG